MNNGRRPDRTPARRPDEALTELFAGALGLRLFEEMIDGCGLHELIVRDGRPVDYRFLAVNAAFERLTGARAEDIVGRTVLEVMPNTEPVWIERYGHVALTGEPVRFEHFSGEVGRHFSVGAFRTSELRFAVTFTDVTERVRSENELRESQARLASIFRLAPVGIGVSRGRVIQEVNERVCTISGYRRDELVGQSSRMLYPSAGEFERAGRVTRADERLHGFATVESTWIRKDGEAVDVLLDSTPLDPDDVHAGTTFMVLDVTDTKRAAREREELERQLLHAQKLEAIGTLAAGIAHDFNNILSAMTGFAELALSDMAAESSARDDLAEVLQAGERARELVGQLLSFARAGDIDDEGDGGTTDISAVVREAGAMLRRSIPTSVAMTLSIAPDCSRVRVDGTRLHQLVVNLVTNAYHAVRGEGEMGSEGRIALSLDAVDVDPVADSRLAALPPGPYVRFVVRDNGHGMDASTRARIFDPYFTTKRSGEGTGLGLAIVHSIVNGTGGMVIVDSAPGEGTTFTIYLPVAEPERRRTEKDADGTVARRGGERVLLVDDDAAVLRMVGRSLERYGYDVTSCADGAAAVAAFSATPGRFDIVVTDQAMPRMTGTQLARVLLAARPDLPVILCTGYSHEISRDKADELGIRRLVFKPTTGGELAAQIRNVLD